MDADEMKKITICPACGALMRPPRRPVLRVLRPGLWGIIVLALAVCDAHASSPIYVIVNVANPTIELSRKDVIGLYMGRTHAFENGNRVAALDLPRESDTRVRFYKWLTGMSPAQINTYWARLIFTGRTSAPMPQPDETAMLEAVRHNPDAIGYLSYKPSISDVRVVFVLDEEPR
jgi:hypothetical protein